MTPIHRTICRHTGHCWQCPTGKALRPGGCCEKCLGARRLKRKLKHAHKVR